MSDIRSQHLLTAFLAVVLTIFAFAVCIGPAFAEDIPIALAASDKATVSEAVDETESTDNGIDTQFFMWIAPDAVVQQAIPKMGEEGLSLSVLLLSMAVTGAGYLACSKISSPRSKAVAKISA